MNCQDALELLYDIIDKEASETDTTQVKAHLENCRHCFEVYRIEGAIQGLLVERVSATGSAVKQENLKSRILAGLDEVDRAAFSKGQNRFFSLSTRSLAVAASVVVLAGAAWLLSDFYRHYTNYIPLERAHWSAVGDVRSYNDHDRTAHIMASLCDRHGCEISRHVADFAMVGGNTERIMGVEMHHFVYTKDDMVVSVFVAPSDRFEIPSHLNDTRVVRNSITFFDYNCRGCRLVFHEAGSAVVITATNHSVDLLDFVPEQRII